MTTTYSTDLRIALIGNGDQDGTWGTTTNTNLGTLIEQAIAGVQAISISSANQALVASNGIADEARNAVIVLTSSAAANVYVPPVDKVYIAKNAGIYAITVYCSTVLGNTTPAGTGVTIPAGKSMLIYSDATNIAEGVDRVNGNLTVGGTLTVTGNITATANLSANNIAITNALPVTSGGTGVTTSTGSGNLVLSASPTFTGTPVAPTASVGTNTTQLATTAFVQAALPSGVIVIWSGSAGAIPSGWYLCDGTNSTPDLRGRFIVGAAGSYAVGATGGSADAIVVSHTHTGTASSNGAHQHYTMRRFEGYPWGYYDRSVADQSFGIGLNDGGGSSYLLSGANDGTFYEPNGGLSSNNGSHTHTITVDTTGSSGTNANLPPYYALCYIMKA